MRAFYPLAFLSAVTPAQSWELVQTDTTPIPYYETQSLPAPFTYPAQVQNLPRLLTNHVISTPDLRSRLREVMNLRCDFLFGFTLNEFPLDIGFRGRVSSWIPQPLDIQLSHLSGFVAETWTAALIVPPDPAVLGVTFYCQAVQSWTEAETGERWFVASNALKGTVGL